MNCGVKDNDLLAYDDMSHTKVLLSIGPYKAGLYSSELTNMSCFSKFKDIIYQPDSIDHGFVASKYN